VSIRLTQTVQKGGCAAKIAAFELKKILSQVRFPTADSSLLVDGSLFDDAAIIRIDENLALVQTLDFFTPIVDSPKLFGRIACANALSDVYAMGGIPKTAMAILAFPLATMATEVVVEVLQGACDLLQEAHVPLVGGHSIDDDTLKFGLSVTGYVHPDKVWSNSRARTGDVLILTKALGTGTMTAALKRSEFSEEQIHEALSSMSQLNSILDLLSKEQAAAIHAATDVTGFGFLGHAVQMAKASGKNFQIQMREIPSMELAKICLEKGYLTKAHKSNQVYVEKDVDWNKADEVHRLLLLDPQTSGGLLLSVDSSQADGILKALRSRFVKANRVGQVVDHGTENQNFSLSLL
jgi:selenide,water dikinase